MRLVFQKKVGQIWLKSRYSSHQTIVIKIQVSKWKRAKSWGDYHLAVLLQKQLKQIGHKVLIQIHPEWENTEGLEYDVVIVFRGLKRYKVKPKQLNILWNISHPDDISIEEYEDYDQVYIASNHWADIIARQVSVPVESMLQCTDPDRFFPPSQRIKNKYQRELLFVGNSRDVYRKIIKDILPTEHDLAVYGKCWKALIPAKYIKGEYIKNHHLYRYYGAADILLNDHWDDMRKKGFVSNRIFDGLACGAFIITDRVEAMGELASFVHTYDDKNELKDLIEHFLNNPEERKKKALRGLDYVKKDHTFKNRAQQISLLISKLSNK